MRSILLIVGSILLFILAIKKYNVQKNKGKQAKQSTANSHIIKNAFGLLPEEFKAVSMYGY